jgi:hypothetical protein
MCIAGSPPLGAASVSTIASPASASSKSIDAHHFDSAATIVSTRARVEGRAGSGVSPSFGALDGEQCVAAEGPDVGRALGHVVWAEGAGDRRCLTHLAAFRSGAELLLTLNPGFRSRAGVKQPELTIGQVAKRADINSSGPLLRARGGAARAGARQRAAPLRGGDGHTARDDRHGRTTAAAEGAALQLLLVGAVRALRRR